MARNTAQSNNRADQAPREQTPEVQTPAEGPGKAAATETAVRVRTKTGNPYRRLGRVWIRDWTSAKVTADERSVLESDPWLEVRE